LKLENTERQDVSSGVLEGFKGNMPVDSDPLKALPTVAPLFHTPKKSLPK
jgi:hypothetical protein